MNLTGTIPLKVEATSASANGAMSSASRWRGKVFPPKVLITEANSDCRYFYMPIKLNRGDSKFVVLYVFLASLITGTVNAEDGLQVLKQAEATMGSISFSAKYEYEDGGFKTRNILFQRTANRGQYEFRRETLMEVHGILLTNISLLNANGLWHILPNEVLRMDFSTLRKQSAFAGLLENAVDLSTEADYDAEVKQINGRECIVVLQKPHQMVEDGLLSKQAQFVEKKIFIGRNDHIVYGCDLKHSDGTIVKTTVTELTVLDKIPDKDFELPPGMPEKICSTTIQYSDIMDKEVQDLVKTPRVRDAFQSFQKRNKKNGYVALSLMTIPTVFFAWFFLRSKFK
jgi:hypothetical protein